MLRADVRRQQKQVYDPLSTYCDLTRKRQQSINRRSDFNSNRNGLSRRIGIKQESFESRRRHIRLQVKLNWPCDSGGVTSVTDFVEYRVWTNSMFPFFWPIGGFLIFVFRRFTAFRFALFAVFILFLLLSESLNPARCCVIPNEWYAITRGLESGRWDEWGIHSFVWGHQTK